MKVFVAGASGAIGRPLIAELLRQGHVVTGMTRSEAGARLLAELGAEVARVSAFDGDAVDQALRQPRAEIIIDQLTSLPKDPSEMATAAPGDRKLRLEGGNLHRAAGASLERRSLIRKTRRLPRDLWATRLGWPTSASHPHKEADPWNLPPLLAPGGPAMEGLPSACARTESSTRSHRRRWAVRLDVSPRTCGPGDRGTLANPGRGRSAPLCRGSARGSRRRRSHLR